jgi:hypothetical protein
MTGFGSAGYCNSSTINLFYKEVKEDSEGQMDLY